eukprot:snap_masked-scaffold_13-processed-gene-11.35-mRNA-1 protein AED:1.00 eAED:1.00 QI:0/-1/0/0/-1/1/1/0/346
MKTKRKRGVLVLGPEEAGRAQFVDALKETEKAPDATQGNEPSNGEQTPLGNGVIINPQQYLELSEKEFHRKILNYCSKYDIVSVVCVIGYGEIDTRQDIELFDIINLFKKRFINIYGLLEYVFRDNLQRFSENSLKVLINKARTKYSRILLTEQNLCILGSKDYTHLLERVKEKVFTSSPNILSPKVYFEICKLCKLEADPITALASCAFHEEEILVHPDEEAFHLNPIPTLFHPGTLKDGFFRSNMSPEIASIGEMGANLINRNFAKQFTKIYDCCQKTFRSSGCTVQFKCCGQNSNGCQKRCTNCRKDINDTGCSKRCVSCRQTIDKKGCLEAKEHTFYPVSIQ